MSEPREPARDRVRERTFEMSPEERDIAYLSALDEGDSRRAQFIARASIPKEWPNAIRLLWLDRRALSGIAVCRDQ